jgi:hypothetical protein
MRKWERGRRRGGLKKNRKTARRSTLRGGRGRGRERERKRGLHNVLVTNDCRNSQNESSKSNSSSREDRQMSREPSETLLSDPTNHNPGATNESHTTTNIFDYVIDLVLAVGPERIGTGILTGWVCFCFEVSLEVDKVLLCQLRETRLETRTEEKGKRKERRRIPCWSSG